MGKGRRFKKVAVILAVFSAIVFVAGVLLLHNANRIIKAELESALGRAFSVQEVGLSWGEVKASHIELKNKAGKTVFTTAGLTIQADFLGLLKRDFVISHLTINEPYVFMEIDHRGNLVNPSLPAGEGGKGGKEKKPLPPFLIKKVLITKGSLDYLDRQPRAGSAFIKVRDIDVELQGVALPPGGGESQYTLGAVITGIKSSGTIKSKGKVRLKDEKIEDAEAKVEVRNVDIIPFRPYFQKRGVNITRGLLDLDMDVKVRARKLHAPGRALLRDLDFKSGPGIGNKFRGVPLSIAVATLKNDKNEITVNFVLEGDLNNPKFSLREGVADKLSLAVANKLGISVKDIGKSVIKTGTEGVKKGVEGIKGVFNK
ncbi:MAG TPA: DUF748 domain-containing protein [Syntrophales bacterium]|nr:DUF748 domain-containing protein [Syntrophales bacterium]